MSIAVTDILQSKPCTTIYSPRKTQKEDIVESTTAFVGKICKAMNYGKQQQQQQAKTLEW